MPCVNEEHFNRAVETLRSNGLDLLAVFDCAALPDPIRALIGQNGIDLASYQRLVLVGNSGQGLWRALKQTRASLSVDPSAHPIDEFSRRKVTEIVAQYLGEPRVTMLYPGDIAVPLQQLGRLAGWHHDSPLGIGIHNKHGLWFAYRAAFLVNAPLPLCIEPATASPCDECQTHDCVAACPAGAVRFSETIDTDTCINFALKKTSPCRTTCLAREACPVAPLGRYGREQITYHYERATTAIEKYRSRSGL